VRSLWTDRLQRHFLPGNVRGGFGLLSHPWWQQGIGVAAGLGLLVTVTMPAPAQAPADQGEFGRWETHLQRCQIVELVGAGPPAALRGCQLLRLDQQTPGQLSVRFLSSWPEGRFTSSELVYAGVLELGSPAMQCRHARCEPRWPMRLLVSAVAPRGVDPRGPTMGIPLARMARGHCQLEKRRVLCQAGEPGGQRWEASGRW
jgi:hypothetical protein